MRAAGSALPCLPACLRACPSSAEAGFTAAPRCTGTEQSHSPFAPPSALSATTRSHTAPVLTPATRGRAQQGFSIIKGGTQQLRRGLTLQFRHQLLPQPHPPPPYPILTNTTTTPLLLLPMPLSSAAPLTSLASIWIEAPCFSSYKSR